MDILCSLERHQTNKFHSIFIIKPFFSTFLKPECCTKWTANQNAARLHKSKVYLLFNIQRISSLFLSDLGELHYPACTAVWERGGERRETNFEGHAVQPWPSIHLHAHRERGKTSGSVLFVMVDVFCLARMFWGAQRTSCVVWSRTWVPKEAK